MCIFPIFTKVHDASFQKTKSKQKLMVTNAVTFRKADISWKMFSSRPVDDLPELGLTKCVYFPVHMQQKVIPFKPNLKDTVKYTHICG